MSPSDTVPNKIKNAGASVRSSVNDVISNEDHKEGSFTRTVEDQTAKIPSMVFLSLAVASMAFSAAIAMRSDRKDLANFVGLWAPSLLILGLYNKIVKTHGSDTSDRF